MTHSKLPDGVPADNEAKQRFAASGEGEYRAPDMATPNYAREKTPAAAPAAVERAGSKFSATTFEDDERTAPAAIPPQVRKLQWFIAIAAVLAALAVLAIAMSGESLPLCSSQPDWNQYNCRAG